LINLNGDNGFFNGIFWLTISEILVHGRLALLLYGLEAKCHGKGVRWSKVLTLLWLEEERETETEKERERERERGLGPNIHFKG
jgi:hypothetical protein